jgi:hypothetical protein
MLSEVPRYQAGVRVEASAGCEADNKGEGLILVKVIRWRARYGDERKRSDSCWKQPDSSFHDLFLPWLLSELTLDHTVDGDKHR